MRSCLGSNCTLPRRPNFEKNVQVKAEWLEYNTKNMHTTKGIVKE